MGAAWLWPSQQKVEIPLPYQNAAGGAVTTESGHVQSTSAAACGDQTVGTVLTTAPNPPSGKDTPCTQALIAIDSGPNSGANTLLEFSVGGGQPQLAVGEHIRITRQVDPTGLTTYSFYDYERAWPLIAMAVLFALVITAVARLARAPRAGRHRRRVRVLVVFMLPALRDGRPAIPVALVSSAVILYAVIYLAHGVSLRTSAALLGHADVTAARGRIILGSNRNGPYHRSLRGGDQRRRDISRQRVDHRSPAGGLHRRLARCAQRRHHHAGVDGVRTGPGRDGSSRRRIFLGAMRVGRDHIASTVYTLVLAYAGSALPLLLLFSVANRSLGDVLTSETVAIEIARSAVGGIALALSVPLTTAIAAVLATPGGSEGRARQPVKSSSVSSVAASAECQVRVPEHRRDVIVNHPERHRVTVLLLGDDDAVADVHASGVGGCDAQRTRPVA